MPYSRSEAVLHRAAVLALGFVLGSCLIGFSPVSLKAQNLIQSPAMQSPHWSHINVYDYGRGLRNPMADDAAKEWFTMHVDATEAHGNVHQLRTFNPGLKFSISQPDLTIFANADSSNLPEEYFLHFSEDTQLQFVNLDGSLASRVTIKGCAPPIPVSRSCRVHLYMGEVRRFAYNIDNKAFQIWKTRELLHSLGETLDGVFLTEHGPGFVETMQWGRQTVLLSGGGIREFGRQQPGIAGSRFDEIYNDAVVDWLIHLASEFRQAGKAISLYSDIYSFDPLFSSQIAAIQGVNTEGFARPDAWGGANHYQLYIDLVKRVVMAGGTVHLNGSWCHTGPTGYTRGLYGSSVARYRMWRLAHYYLLKESLGNAGMVYFSPAFCSNMSMRPSYDKYEWLYAYQVNIGVPSGEAYVYQQGTVGRNSTDGRPCSYRVFARPYTAGTVLVRPQDAWDCKDYSDSSAVVLTLPQPVPLLMEDGTLSDLTSVVKLRNAEAVVLFGNSENTSIR